MSGKKEDMKRCSKCKEIKELSEFYNDKTHKDGLSSLCKICSKQNRKNYYNNHKEKEIDRAKEYYTKNKIHYKQYYQKNKDKLILKAKVYRQKWSSLTQDKKTKILKRVYLYTKNRYHTDVSFKLKIRLRDRLRRAIKNSQKSGSAVRDLGCSIEKFKLWIEFYWKDGMSWDNYGEWHLDHIKPLSKFNLTDRNQLLEACHFTNIQPLWAHENLAKSDKVE